jgi:hypothetical protein
VIEGCVGDEGAGRLRTHADRPRRARGPGAPAIGIVAIQPTRAEPSPRAARAETILTPVTQSVPSPPRWCRGDDGRVHMQYELLLTNTVPLLVDVTTLAVRGDGRSIETLSADQLAAAMTLLGSEAGPTSELPAATVEVVWIDLVFASRRAVPERVNHRLTVDVGPGLPVGPTTLVPGCGRPAVRTSQVEARRFRTLARGPSTPTWQARRCRSTRRSPANAAVEESPPSTR